ncbi:pro-FMRFamide-related neuropeptide VF [Salminus brasiliensis]|uniref:pro-FMRFamide-related neuropeptide VF n=1 Tax=Salminus brasiliensis TaxID=930266 RepID=UPI003B833A46
MSVSVLSLTLGILSSLLFQDVSTVRLPLMDENDPNRIPNGIFSENTQDIPRSLEMEEFTFNVVPTSGRASSPTILRLHPIAAKPSHLHANLPLRFGREVYIQRTPKSSINLPQRFGRSQELDPSSGQLCTECRRAESPPSATLPQRFGRRNLFVGDPLRALAVFTRTLESPLPRDRSEDYDYMLETIQEEDKALKSKNYIGVD